MSKPHQTWVHGCSGKTGQFVAQSIVEAKGFSLAGGSGRYIYSKELEKTDKASSADNLAAAFTENKVELVIDFSGADGNSVLLKTIKSMGTNGPDQILVASTGLDEAAEKSWASLEQSKKVLFAPNTSVGILVMKSLLKKAIPTLSKLGFDMDVREAHHIHKLDSPSGTTKSILTEYTQAGVQEDKVQVHVERRGGVFGLHSSIFTSPFEEITISHQAFSRKLFGDGSVMLANWLNSQPYGIYSLEDVEKSIFNA